MAACVSHCIDGDQRAGQFEALEQQRDSSVSFDFTSSPVGQARPLAGPPSQTICTVRGPWRRVAAARVLPSTAMTLAIMVAQGFDPVWETGLEEIRIERVDHVALSVSCAGMPALVGQETAQKVEPFIAPEFWFFDEILHAAQRRAPPSTTSRISGQR